VLWSPQGPRDPLTVFVDVEGEMTRPLRSSRRPAVLLPTALLIVLAQAIGIAGTPRQAPRPLRVTPVLDLGAVVGSGSCAHALNELGTAVGVRREFGLVRGFSWSPDAVPSDLGPDTTALAVNDRGEIAGQGNVTGTGLDARVWTRDGTMTVAVGIAHSLNNRTEVVGFHLPPVGDPPINHAFRWTPERGLEDVESLTGETPPWSYFAPLSIARVIRGDGVMAGERGGLAVLWRPDGQVTPLGPGVANSVNDGGVAVGSTSLSNGRPVVWWAGSGTILTDTVGEATDVNAPGYVVGWMMVGGDRHGFVWHPRHGLQDLGPGAARDIDEIGHIAGCRGGGDEARATVWQLTMADAELLAGFEALARRLLADVDARASRAVFRHIALAQQGLRHGHGKAARRHLERAVRAIADLGREGTLAPDWAAALKRIGRSIAERL
jgi:hypothetical protein